MVSPRAQVGSLAKALGLLQRFSDDHAEWSVSALAEISGISKGSVSKILGTFLSAGFLVQDAATHRYRLGPAILAAGRVAERSTDVVAASDTPLRDLAQTTGETAALMLRSGWRTVLVAKVDSSQPIRMSAEVGKYASLHSGASNKPVLAFMGVDEVEAYLASPLFVRRGPRSKSDPLALQEDLKVIRATGVAWSEEEVEEGVAALGAPVFDGKGRVTGAVSIIGPASRMSLTSRERLSDAVKGAAMEITRLHGWLGPWPSDPPSVPALSLNPS